MRILIAANEKHIPHAMGGGPMAIHHLALTLRSHGHDVAVVSALPGRGRVLGYRLLEQLTGRPLLRRRDTGNGYPVYRAGTWAVPRLLGDRLAERRPDAVIVQGTGAEVLAKAVAGQGIPVVMRQIADGSVTGLAAAAARDRAIAQLLRSPLVRIVSVSQFIDARLRELTGVGSTVIYPPIRLSDSLALGRTPEFVTFVNPIDVKGLPVALAVARLLPHRRFLFAEAWNTARSQRRHLDAELARLPNVTFRRRSVGLKEAYRATAVLLMPSQWPEAFGRVVVEASANGIPVVASRVGGIPEAAGESGVLLDAGASADKWAEAVEQFLSDPICYAQASAQALVNARRPEFAETVVAGQYLGLLAEHAMQRTAR
ncbi:MAG TPA: glycosyltransferase [Streptosporangiaceae bacterium]